VATHGEALLIRHNIDVCGNMAPWPLLFPQPGAQVFHNSSDRRQDFDALGCKICDGVDLPTMFIEHPEPVGLRPVLANPIKAREQIRERRKVLVTALDLI